MAQNKYKRRTFIIDPGFQYRMIRRLCIIGITIIIMSLLFLAIVHHLYGDVKLMVNQPDPFKSAMMLTSHPTETASLFALIWPVMAICVGITLIFLFSFGVIVSHRMAGPIYRIRMTLQEMAKGNLSGDIRLRKKDEFKHLAKELNTLKASLRKTIMNMSDIAKSTDHSENIDYRNKISKIADILSGFKID